VAALNRSRRRSKLTYLLSVLYLVVMSHLLNRVYYSQFVNMDEANLTQTIANVLLYTCLELVTLAVAHFCLRRLLRVSPTRQLGFVLSRQAVHVQSALLLWVVFSTQAPLDHYGKRRLEMTLAVLGSS